MKYIKDGDIQDEEIITSIYAAANEYENGEVLKARDRMLEIVITIDEYIEGSAKQRKRKESKMSKERDTYKELNSLAASIRKAGRNIAKIDASNELKVVDKLIDLENTVKSIIDSIVVPEFTITEDTSIEYLREGKLLPAIICNRLHRVGIENIRDITNKSAFDICALPDIGKKYIHTLTEFLEEHGFSLKQCSKEEEIYLEYSIQKSKIEDLCNKYSLTEQEVKNIIQDCWRKTSPSPF